jgi:hypothetical protein
MEEKRDGIGGVRRARGLGSCGLGARSIHFQGHVCTPRKNIYNRLQAGQKSAGPRDREKPHEHLAFAGNTIHQRKRVSAAMDGQDALQEPDGTTENGRGGSVPSLQLYVLRASPVVWAPQAEIRRYLAPDG